MGERSWDCRGDTSSSEISATVSAAREVSSVSGWRAGGRSSPFSADDLPLEMAGAMAGADAYADVDVDANAEGAGGRQERRAPGAAADANGATIPACPPYPPVGIRRGLRGMDPERYGTNEGEGALAVAGE